MPEEAIITIIGTKKFKQEDSEYAVYSKSECVKRVEELLDDNYGYSVVQARK